MDTTCPGNYHHTFLFFSSLLCFSSPSHSQHIQPYTSQTNTITSLQTIIPLAKYYIMQEHFGPSSRHWVCSQQCFCEPLISLACLLLQRYDSIPPSLLSTSVYVIIVLFFLFILLFLLFCLFFYLLLTLLFIIIYFIFYFILFLDVVITFGDKQYKYEEV